MWPPTFRDRGPRWNPRGPVTSPHVRNGQALSHLGEGCPSFPPPHALVRPNCHPRGHPSVEVGRRRSKGHWERRRSDAHVAAYAGPLTPPAASPASVFSLESTSHKVSHFRPVAFRCLASFPLCKIGGDGNTGECWPNPLFIPTGSLKLSSPAWMAHMTPRFWLQEQLWSLASSKRQADADGSQHRSFVSVLCHPGSLFHPPPLGPQHKVSFLLT